MFDAYLGLGANVGACVETLGEAVRRLDANPDVTVAMVSSLYRTRPVGGIAQPDFWNAVAAVRTSFSPDELLAYCLRIEADLGRVRRERWGPRVIDLDLLWHSEGERCTATLTLPHPRMTERAFVMRPLAEIAPDLNVAGRRADDWANVLGEEGIVADGPLKWRMPV